MLLETSEQIIARIARAALPSGPNVIAFDGDGTLWSGDVGDDFLDVLLEEDGIRDEAFGPVRDAATVHGIDADGSAAVVVRRLAEAHRHGTFPEAIFYELTAWLCAGWERAEVMAFAGRVLTARNLEARFHRETVRLLEWARSEGLSPYLVSASPSPIVERAAELLGLGSREVVAVSPRYEGARMLAGVDKPVPYGPGKVDALRLRTGGARLVAAFGDNAFDVPMLQAAAVPVAVRPKRRLREQAAQIDGLIEMRAE